MINEKLACKEDATYLINAAELEVGSGYIMALMSNGSDALVLLHDDTFTDLQNHCIDAKKKTR